MKCDFTLDEAIARGKARGDFGQTLVNFDRWDRALLSLVEASNERIDAANKMSSGWHNPRDI